VELTPPECRTEPLTPCSESDWVQCAACGRLVCQIHDERITVLHSGEEPTGADEVCPACIESLYEIGEVSMGEQYQYVNRR
jgi:hypothetical protein